jgi:hypothetical protein
LTHIRQDCDKQCTIADVSFSIWRLQVLWTVSINMSVQW